MKRKLASLQRIKEIRPIPDADAIEVCVVNGWQCVSKKGEFKEGDLCVYFEIDSYLPIEDKYEFLRGSSYKAMKMPNGLIIEEGFRLKTIRLRGQISQGLVLPLNLFDLPADIQYQDDVTDILNVIKYDPPIPAHLSGQIKGDFPDFIKKTEQERIQNIFDKLKQTDDDTEWEVSIKLDGTSCTYFIIRPEDIDKFHPKIDYTDDQEVDYFKEYGYIGHCSRNLETKNTRITPWIVGKELLESMKNSNSSFAIQGELIGSGIQKNNEKLKNQEFYCFDIWDINKQEYMSKVERDQICKNLNIKQVPTLENVKLSKFKTIDDILEFSDGSSLNTSSRREGLVFKSVCGKKSFKVISNRYLLGEKYE
jgi:RNA ligase (TIGR02306 family)